jgi:vitamin B12 transporter
VLADGKWETGLSAAVTRGDRRYTNRLDPADPNQETQDSTYAATEYDLQWTNTVHLPGFGPAAANALTFGYQHTRSEASSRLRLADFGLPYASSVEAAEDLNAGWAGLQTTLARRLTLNANLRAEGYSIAGSAVTWRMGGVLALPELASRLKASGGTAFRAPSLFELYGRDSYGYHGNPGLQPERGTGWDIGWESDLGLGARADFATLGLTYFANRFDNLITTDYVQETSVNVGRAESRGVEASATFRPAAWWSTTLAYTYTDARNLQTGAALLRRPRQQVSAEVALHPLPGLTIAPEILYTGAFQDLVIDDFGFPVGIGRARPGTLVNLAASYVVDKRLTLWLRARNLGGARTETASGFAAPGASVLAGVKLGL